MSTGHSHWIVRVPSFYYQTKRGGLYLLFLFGAVDGTRTRTVSPPGDFKSLTLYRSICPELDNCGLFCPDITRKLRQTPGISNSYRHHSTFFDLLLLPPIFPCFAMVFCNLEGCWRDEKTHPSGFDLIQQKHYISFPRC